MLSSACCDPAIQAAVAAIQGGDYAGSPRLQARLIGDYQNRSNWTYDQVANTCTWTAPQGAFYSLDSGAPANVSTPSSVDAAHYGGGCVAGGLPNTTTPPVAAASAATSPASTLLLVGVGAAVLWYLFR